MFLSNTAFKLILFIKNAISQFQFVSTVNLTKVSKKNRNLDTLKRYLQESSLNNRIK
ncbi:hypothetical protein RCH33_2913 [Flavobacterium daejeonense]|nr:hypothetical protein RCH33_2913 [Flavobacterium daejeonense]